MVREVPQVKEEVVIMMLVGMRRELGLSQIE